MKAANYWASQNTTRRRFLRTSAAGILGSTAVLLLSCGDDNSSEVKDTSGLLTKPVDTTSKAVRGGVMPVHDAVEPTDWDGLASGAVTSSRTAWLYSRLLKHVVGKYPNVADGSVEGDSAESFELSPDALQITLKLRPNLQFDSRAPTNGRALDSSDVQFSWNKFSTINPARTEVVNKVSPDSPILSLETPDARTVVVKLAYPFGSILETLAWQNYIQIQPKEADGGFDPKREVRGSGAWAVEEYRPSAYIRYRRNPNWYVKDRPFLNGLEVPIISEYSTALAQFKAGHLASFATIRAEDVVPTKRDVQQLEMRQAAAFARTSPFRIGLSYQPGTPFHDERVRQAMSMLIDRQLFNQVFFSLDKYEAEGLPTNSRWHTIISPGFEKFWLDPRKGGDFGQGAELYQHKPEESRKLLQAAGVKTPLETKFVSTFNGYGDAFVKQGEIVSGMLQDSGLLKLEQTLVDFNSQYRFGYFWSKAGGGASNGEQDGIVHLPGAPTPYLDAFLYSSFHSKGSRVKTPFADPVVDDLIMKQRADTSEADRVKHIQDLQRHLTKKMYVIPNGGLSLGFELGWPWISNQGVYSSWSSPAQEANTYLWFDESKKT